MSIVYLSSQLEEVNRKKESEGKNVKYFDEVLQQEVEVQEEITPEIGREMKIEDPIEFEELFKEAE